MEYNKPSKAQEFLDKAVFNSEYGYVMYENDALKAIDLAKEEAKEEFIEELILWTNFRINFLEKMMDENNPDERRYWHARLQEIRNCKEYIHLKSKLKGE